MLTNEESAIPVAHWVLSFVPGLCEVFVALGPKLLICEFLICTVRIMMLQGREGFMR